MENYGPLYHRNSPLWPKAAGKCLIGLAVLVGILELVLGIASLAS